MKALLPIAKGLAHETRLRILRILARGPFTVNEMVGVLGQGQSHVSHHLKILSESGLVAGERHGTHVFYSLVAADGIETPQGRLLSWLSDELARGQGPDDTALTACLLQRSERARRFFSEKASDWDHLRDRVMGPPDYLLRLAEAMDGVALAVDLGTGTGSLLRHLGSHVERVIGVDASAEMLEVARGNLTRWGLQNVDLRLGTLEHLPMGDGEADGAVANMVLHHLHHPLAALREIRRVLEREGRLLVVELSAHEDESFRDILGDHWLGIPPERLEQWLAEAAFAPESLEEVTSADPGDSRGNGRRPGVYLTRARAC